MTRGVPERVHEASIVLTSRFALTQPGGIETAVRIILQRLSSERPEWDIRAVHAFRQQTRWNQIPFAGDLAAALILAYRSRGADVVLVNGAEYAWPQLFTRRGRNRTIVVWHGTRVGEIPALVEQMTFPIRIYLWLEKWLQRFALFARRHVAVSVSTIAEIYETYGRLRAVALIPNGAPPKIEVRETVAARDEVAWIGTTPYKKGLDIAIAACAMVRRTRPALRLVAIGASAPKGAPTETWIDYLGPVDHADAMAALDGCSVLLGSTRYEGCSMAIIESMARGLPIVAGPKIAWMVEDAGISVDDYAPASFAVALEAVLGDDALRARLATSGPERAARFDWASATQAYAREIEACL